MTAEAVLALVGDTQGLLDLEEFRIGLLDALQRAIPADFVSLNDIGPAPDDLHVIVRPSLGEDAIALFGRLAHQNPLIERYRQTGDGRAYRFSDVVTQDELHATELYREFYGPLGVEHQIAFTLPAAPERLLGVALTRSDHDFSDAERDLIDRARPFLIQGYRNAIAYTELASDGGRPGMTPTPAAIEALVARGLTTREAEVIRWALAGHASAEVATTLGISLRTVQKHLERAYRKLGVRTRADAASVVAAADAAGGSSQAPPATA